MEGYKISTTEYYGLQNIGLAYLAISFLFSIILFCPAAVIYILMEHYLERRILQTPTPSHKND